MSDPLMVDLAARLSETIEGEVRFDHPSRVLYSTDASIYQIEPLGVVIPRRPDDVYRTFELAREAGVPVLPRGAGTSLAGQTVGRAIVIDASKYLNRVLEVRPEEGWVNVEPGLVQDDLNRHLRPLGFIFGPDTATANRATLGGMIGNNSAGAHSIVYGKTVDHVLSIEGLLASGESRVFSELDSASIGPDGLEGRIAAIVNAHQDSIRTRFPKLMRRVSGYNLDELLGDRMNLARLLVGSEGTLAWTHRARLKIEPRPPATALMVVHFREMAEAVEATETILPFRPAAVEMIDDMILGLARRSPGFTGDSGFIEGFPAALLIVEFFGEDAIELESRLERLEATLRRGGLGYAFPRAVEPEDQTRIWNVRKAGLGLLLGMKGDRKPIAFVEDCAVEPRQLPEFFRRFRQIVDEFGTTAGYYGHASVGCLHIRPLIDTRRPSEVRKMKAMMEAVVELVLEFGGAMSGEHGDGLARSHLNERLFGEEVYGAFKAVKQCFDPENRMNPGKIVDAPGMDENLRHGNAWRPLPETETHYDFGGPGGFAAAVELCSGIGACRKTGEGTMCPSYMVTREEEHSTRGRANLMRTVLSGRLQASELNAGVLYEALDLCLECKACKLECPLGVDMAKLKYEFLATYNATHPPSARSRLFANVRRWNRMASLWPEGSNWLMSHQKVRRAAERWLGIDRRRKLPLMSPVTFERWFRERARSGEPHRNPAPGGRVVLFNDTFMNFNEPEIGQAATRLLEAAGYEVALASHACCGRPMISKGFAGEARQLALSNARELGGWIERGYSVVGCEPSCLLTFRDEYPDLIGKAADGLRESTFLLEEFIERETRAGRWRLRFTSARDRALLHTHCHQRALTGSGALRSALADAYEIREIDSGCCGMAGAFGYEQEHYETSIAIAEMRLLPEIAASQSEIVIATGTSCRQQIQHGSGRTPLHPAQALARMLDETEGSRNPNR